MTETTTIKEGSNATPIDPEKKSDVKVDKVEETTPNKPEAEITTDPKPETKEEETVNKETVKEEPVKEEEVEKKGGYLNKNTPKIIGKFWRKYYFAFGEDEKVPLDQLRLYYKKSVRRPIVPTTKTPGMVNATTEGPAEETKEPVPETKKTEEPVSEKVETKEPEETIKPEESTSEKVEDKKSEEPVSEKVEKDKKPEESTSEKVDKDNKPEEPTSEKVDETKKPEDKKSEQITSTDESKGVENNVLLANAIRKNIAHATQTGKGLLFYYKSDSEPHKKQPLGIINLKDIEDVESTDTKQFGFNVITCYRVFELAADSNSDRKLWIKTITEKMKEEDTINVESSDGYKEMHKKLVDGNAFNNVNEKLPISDTDVLSDEDETPRDIDKRKSVFSPLSLFGRKPSTTETSVVAQPDDNDATRDVNANPVTTEGKTEETKEEGSSKSPQKGFLSKSLSIHGITFGWKGEKSTETKEETNVVVTKDDVIVEDTEDTAVITANGTETTEENKKKGWMENFNRFKKSISTPKEETPKEETPKEETPKEETSKDETPKEETSTETTENKEATPVEGEARQKEQKDQKEKDTGIFRLFKGKAKDENKVENKVENTEASKAESTEDTTTPKSEEKTEAKVEEKSTEKQDKDEHASVVRRVTQILRRSKSPKTDSTSREALVEDVNKKGNGTEDKPTEDKPTEDKPTEDKPTEDKSTEVKSTEETPAEENSAEKVDESEAIPESSNAPNTTEENKGRKSSIFENLKSKIGVIGGGKRQNSLPQDPQEKMEPETTAVTSPSEATDDVENVDKPRDATTKVEDSKKEPENAVQKPEIPDGFKKGNLHKQTYYLKNYEVRYFVLTKDKLYYSRSSSEQSPYKTIDISSDCKVKIPEVKAAHFSFDLETKGRTYKLYADTEEERNSWIEALKECGVAQHEKEQSSSSKKSDDVTRLEVANSDTDLQEEVVKAADAAAASVSEIQEKTTKSTVTETNEKGETKEETKGETEVTTVTEEIKKEVTA